MSAYADDGPPCCRWPFAVLTRTIIRRSLPEQLDKGIIGRWPIGTVTEPGRYNFGDGLFLDVKPLADGVGKYWLYAYNGTKVGESARERIGFASAKTMPLKVARRESLLLDQVLEAGNSPKVHREQLRMTTGDGLFTWKQAVLGFYEVCMRERWNSKHSRTLGATMVFNYLLPGLDPKTIPITPKVKPPLAPWKWTNLPLQATTHLHVYEILKTETPPYRKRKAERAGADMSPGPLFKTKPEMGKRIQCFLYGMYQYWKARFKFKGENPANKESGSLLYELIGSFPRGGHLEDMRVDEVPPLIAFLHEPQRDPRFITSDQLATALGISPIAIKNARKRYGLKGHKEPGRMFKNASYVYEIAEAERVFKRPIPPVTVRADELLYASMLEMAVLCLAREDMVAGMLWDEIKPRWENSVQGVILWHKHKTEHHGYKCGTVITPRIQTILDRMWERRKQLGLKSPYVFPHGPVTHGCNRWLDRRCNGAVIRNLLNRCAAQIDCIETKHATVHGLRTTFTTWACDIHDYDQDLAMITIGHKIKGSDADQVYLRNTRKLRKRYEMMLAWGDDCYSQVKQPKPKRDNKVVPLFKSP
jgi:integrase